MDQVLKIAEIKRVGSIASTTKTLVKEILGTMFSCKVTCDGKDPKVVQKEIDQGVYDSKFQ
jgi:large subunit ribosomal protein L11